MKKTPLVLTLAALFCTLSLVASRATIAEEIISLAELSSHGVSGALAAHDYSTESLGDKADDGDCLCCCPLWTTRAGLVYMQRSKPDSRTLISEGLGNFNGAEVLNASEFGFNWEEGLDVSLARKLNADTALEIRYLGLFEWHETIVRDMPFEFTIHTDDPLGAGFDFTNTQSDFTYDSRLHSVEANISRGRENCTVFAGVRYLRLEEQLQMNIFRIVTPVPSVYNWKTKNDLVGVQLGGRRALWDNGCGLRVEGTAAAGIYYNDADARFDIVGQAGTPVRDGKEELAFVGEASLFANYDLANNIALRAGYQLMVIDGVSLASRQVRSTRARGTNGIDAVTDGDVFYHGGFLGVEYRR